VIKVIINFMPEIPQTFIFDDFSSGMIDSGAVSDSLLPKNAVRKAVNFVFDSPRGALVGRFGSTLLGANLGTAVKGIANFRDAGSGTDNQLIATDSTGKTYYLNGATFTQTLTGDTVALKTRYVTFLDRIARLNGTDAVKSWNGAAATPWSAASGVLDEANWPALTKFALVFNSRIYTAGSTSAPDTLYYSSLPSGGAISWTSGNGSLQVNPNDGNGGITGLAMNGTVALIFKRTSLYRWDGSATFANEVIRVGTPSQESIATHDAGWVYFFGIGKNNVGAYRTTGGYPQKISLNISRWFEAISPTNYDNIAGFVDDDHYYLSVGSVTIDGQTYTNAWFVYTISMQTWHIENRATSFTVFSSYIDGNGAVNLVGGDTSGNVQLMNSGTTDNGVPISGEAEFAPIVFTSRARTKKVSPAEVSAYASFFQGIKFFMKADSGDFKEWGELQNTEQRFDLGQQMLAKRFYPKITFTNSYTPCQFDGFEFNKVSDEGYYK
jgi:hypothetical protein